MNLQKLVDDYEKANAIGFKTTANKNLLTKGEAGVRTVHNRQEELLLELDKYVNPNSENNNFVKIAEQIKETISEKNLTSSDFKEGQKIGGRHTKKRAKINKKK